MTRRPTPDDYYRTVILTDERDLSAGDLARDATAEVVAADLIVVRHGDGTYTVVKAARDCPADRVPFDDLPSRVKASLPRWRSAA